jgi:two-component system, OmpR family, phosphate regulon sensor histidine kinase PhoR
VVDAAIGDERQAVAAADHRRSRIAQLVFAGLAVGVLLVALLLAVLHQRHLLAPLEDIRRTLLRLTTDRSARVVLAGPGELRAVAGSLNGLATQTERLLADEQARNAGNELRQSVAAVTRGNPDLAEAAARLAELIGTAMAADAVHGRLVVRADAPVDVRWPVGAAALSSRTVADILGGAPGTVVAVPNTAGAIAVPLTGDGDCPPGLIHLVRHGDRPWTGDECRLLAGLAREIGHALRQWRLQDRQARLIAELRALDERKDAFVATVTHELRTPLTTILGYTEALADGDGGELSPMQRRGVTAILRNALRLRDTVADLALMRAGVNRGGGPGVPVDLAAVTSAAHAAEAPGALAKGLVMTLHTEPVWVSGDAGQLRRAVGELIGNAVKFTPAGGRISCRLTDAGDRARLVVADTGIGIPAADLPRLYTPFHRAANAMDQAVQGAGVGLAIAHTIVTEHGGAITAESVPGSGSTFTVTLPAVTLGLVNPAEARPGAAARSGRR